jgi:hypothetical protein
MLILNREKIPVTILVDAYAQWMDLMKSDGAKLYYVNFMFERFSGLRSEVVHKMKHLIERFYSHYVTQFTHHPLAPGEQKRLPQFWLYPDLPVSKKHKGKTKTQKIEINSGLHFNGAMIIRSPLRGETKIRGIKRHIRENQKSYAKNGIARIHVTKIRRDYSRLSDYALKTISANRCDENDILILPKARSELISVPNTSPIERRFKHLISAHHLSPETAAALVEQQPLPVA